LVSIRKATEKDHNEIWNNIRQVLSSGDTIVFDPGSSKEKMIEYWFSKEKHTYIAEMENRIVGTFFIRDNLPDLGSHIANAAYMTLPEA
jgi:hypothetical protein